MHGTARTGTKRAAIGVLAMLASGMPVVALGAGNAQTAATVRQGVDAASRNDFATAVKLWQAPAAAGDADAQFNLAMAYKNGLGVTADLAHAEELFRKAATQGHVDAGDQYGLLLFQTGRRREALPWLESAAEHGEERAQYVLGTAHYNGDFVPKDWVAAYALMSSAAGQGLIQARSSLAMMDQTIPLEQRQQGIALAQDMQKKAASLRGSQLAQTDLGAPRMRMASATPPPSAAVERPAPSPVAGPASAGASFAPHPVAPAPRRVGAARPAPATVIPPQARPTPAHVVARQSAPPASPAGGGHWKVQLGAFGQAANASALWAKASARAELAGKRRVDVPGGSVTRLQAAGFADEAAATRACNGLKGAGLACVVVHPGR